MNGSPLTENLFSRKTYLYTIGPCGRDVGVGDVPVVVDGGVEVADAPHQHGGTHVVEAHFHSVNLKGKKG